MKAMSKSILFFFCTTVFYAQAMDLNLERELVQGTISIQAYLSAKAETSRYKNDGYSDVIKEITTADYSRHMANLYDELIVTIGNSVAAVAAHPLSNRNLAILARSITQEIERIYEHMLEGKNNGTIRRGRAT